MSTTDTVVLVRPRRGLVRTAFVSIVLAMIPVFGVLYWFAVQHDSWWLVFVVHLAITIACLGALFRQLCVYAAVTETALVGRGIFSPMVRVPLDRVASAVIVPTYVGQSPDAVQQLLVRDASGARLFRMRGNFWHGGDLLTVADALPVPPTIEREPMSTSEFFRRYPGSAYWFENRPAIWVAAVAITVLAVLAITAWVMTVLGMRVAFLPH